MTPLNVNKMAVSGWISMKFGMSGLHKILHEKKNSQKNFFCRYMGQNVKMGRFLAKNRKNAKNAIFFAKMGKIVPNMDFNEHLGGIHKFDQLNFEFFPLLWVKRTSIWAKN